MWYVYVLRNEKNGDLYKGFTADLKARVRQHKSKATKTTKNGEWALIYYEAFILEKDARREEKFLKTGKGRDRLRLLLQSTMEGGQDGNARVLKTRGSNP